VNILLVSPEIAPFAKTGGLGDVAEILPISLNAEGRNASAIMPFYGLVTKNGYSPKTVEAGIEIELGGEKAAFDLLSLEFIKNDGLYKREFLYGTPKGDYEDNAIRYAFFAKAVLASIPYIGKPDILHLNDWQCGLIPFYIKRVYADADDLKDVKTLFTIHNLAYQGLFGREILPKIDLSEELYKRDGIEYWNKISYMKTAIIYADAISTVSKGYSREILTKEFGCGHEEFLKKRKDDLYGIVNGADYSTWNPETDKFIARNFSAKNLTPKLECKKDVLKEFGIPFKEDVPLVGLITRLAEQKGVDLIAQNMEELLSLGVNFIILGTGEERYNRLYRELDKKFKGRAGARVAFDNALAHKIEAGSDIFLMPSRYEPCGLNQMYSMRYRHQEGQRLQVQECRRP
jgi:starch synthase